MNPNMGKTSFSSKASAEKAAKAMRRKHGEAFTTYESRGSWYVGGRFLKPKPKAKVKSLQEIRQLWQEDYFDHQEDLAVNNYVEQVENNLARGQQESVAKGDDAIWTLVGFGQKTGIEVGLKNNTNYLVLEITNGLETIYPKMGGAFSRHIPLMIKIAERLKDKPVIWSTWNNKGSSWTTNDWFYRLDLNESVEVVMD